MDICIVCHNIREADYWWCYTLNSIYNSDKKEYFNLSYNRHFLRIYFGNFTLNFVSENNYDRWSRGRHNAKVMTQYQYQGVLEKHIRQVGDNDEL